MKDAIFVLQWWFMLFGLGLLFLPLTTRVFHNFYDRGYVFSKTLGIALLSYTVFVLGIFKILPFTSLTLYLVIWLFFLLNIFIAQKYTFIKTVGKHVKIFLLEEFIFLAGLIFWAYIRGHEPSIHNLEKFMDFGFINSALRSTYLPPKDMWFTPLLINYYYFGHFATALLTKLSTLPSFITYNLMLATLFSLTFVSAFSIGANLLKNFKFQISNFKLIIAGLLSAIFVALAGNLHTIYSLFLPYKPETPQPLWELAFSPLTLPNSYWYANATRFIPLTIHEFPIYSFVVADLHGHVIDIPFVLLTIAILLSIFLKHTSTSPIQNSKFKIFNYKLQLFTFNFSLLTLLALMLAVLYVTNVWDGIIYFLLTALVFLFLFLKTIDQQSNQIFNWTTSLFIVIAGFILFSLPFNLHFKPFVSGIGILCAPSFLTSIQKLGPFLFEPNHCQKSAWWQLLILYGFFYFWVISFLIFLLIKKGVIQNSKFKIQNYNSKFKIFNYKLQLFTFNFKFLTKSDIFVLLLILLSTLLIITPEFIYVKDIYPAHYRANTMFKLVYQAFIMLSLSSAYIIMILLKTMKKVILFVVLVVFLTPVLIYPYFSIQSYYQTPPSVANPCKNPLNPVCFLLGVQKTVVADLKNYKGLNGIAYLKDLYPDDYRAIIWINKNIRGQPVVLEAQGDSYTDYERISANTGLPTVLGWTVHEWLWRGTYDVPAPRIEEVKTIYEGADIEKTVSLLKKYNVSYVYIGRLERQKYPAIYERKFETLGEVVFRTGETKVYKVFK